MMPRHYLPLPSLLKEYIILVTGAAKGIGSAVAKAYASHGATVIILDKNIATLEKTYDNIVAVSESLPAIYPLDLKGASASDYDDLANRIDDNFGRLDGMVHCAASLGQLAPIQHQNQQIWLETLHINLTAPYLLTRACLPLLQRGQKPVSVIFTTDGRKDRAYWSGYGIAKAGIESFSKQLADELEASNYGRSNCIDPGIVHTELHVRAFPAIDPTNLAKPEDVVNTYLYLMGKDSLTINGQLVKAQ